MVKQMCLAFGLVCMLSFGFCALHADVDRDSSGQPVSGCNYCAKFKFGSCETEHGKYEQRGENIECPPVECFSEGSCQLASNYFSASGPDYDQERQIAVAPKANEESYRYRVLSLWTCSITLGCDDCYLNPDTLLLSCRYAVYDKKVLVNGAICYNYPNSAPLSELLTLIKCPVATENGSPVSPP
jgi:hypothetical protein